MLLGTVACLATYVALILARPSQTPVIVLTAPAYPNPLPPNAWSDEDVGKLDDLDGETMALHDARGSCASRAAVLESLERQLDETAKSDPHGPVVIYLGLHGAVDGQGRPCLVPPRASPVDSSTWLPVERIFAALAGHPRSAGRETLVVLDADRLEVEWQLGIARNTFVERLTELLDAPDGLLRRSPRLAVLTAAGVDEVSQTSRELGGSAFMHFFRQGLAGEADRRRAGGDGDSRVSLRELHAYLERTVPDWSRRNRDAAQTPVLVANDGFDFPVAWVCRKTLPERAPPPRAVPYDRIADLWSRAERLERFHPTRYAPLLWSEVRRSLLYLEQASDAGAAYSAAARSVAEDVDARLTKFEKQTPSAAGAPWDVFRTDEGTPTVRVPARSLALRRAFGVDDGERYAAWAGLGEELPAARLLDTADEIDPSDENPADEAHFLRLLAGSPAVAAPPDRLAAAASLHRLGEAAAAPADVRVWPWIRDRVLRGDEARRRAEDALMSGGHEDIESEAAAEAAYREAVSRGDEAAETWALLDAVRGDQIPLARWLTDPRHRRPAGDRPHLTTELVDAVLLPLIDETTRLAHDMLASETGVGTGAESVRSLHGRLRTEFDRAYAAALDDRSRTPAAVRELDVLLATPLLPSASRQSLSPSRQRAALLQKRADLARDLATAAPSELPADAAEPLRQAAARWPQHPLSALLADGDDEAAAVWPRSIADPADAERVGELTRGWLDAVSFSVGEPRSKPADGNRAAMPAEEIHDLRRSVARLRVAASLKEFFPAAVPSPVGRLTKVELAAFLADQGRRKTDDFWGPAVPDGPAFFEAAADDLAAAEALAGGVTDVAVAVDATRRLLESRRQAAREGVRVKACDVLLTSSGRSAADVAMRPGVGDVPEGVGAVVAGRVTRWDLAAPRPVRLPVPPDGGRVGIELAAGAVAPSDVGSRVAVLFRGHIFDAPLLVATPAGPTTVFVPPPKSPTTLTVRSTSRKKLSVVFVLDCSASMSETAASESSGVATRLDLARSALGRMLEELATRPGTRVGVVFYGHRVGWRRVRTGDSPDRFQRSTQREYARPVPDGVMPFDDVEVVAPLGRFDGGFAGEVEGLMESLRPWGETPLYLAIDAALRQFGEDDADAERSVIVVTDGLNEQSNPTPAARKTPADVLTTWRARKAAIEIIGFALSPGEAGRAAAEFGRLAEATGGSFEPAGRATELIAALERRLGPASFRVLPAAGGDALMAPVGHTLRLDDPGAAPSELRVEVDGKAAAVDVEGGEGLELIAGDAGPIVSARYTDNSPTFTSLVASGSGAPSGVLLGLHRPRRGAEGSVTFEFSLQNEDQTFLARPSAVWAEITPVRGDEAGVPYVFSHRGFVAGTPVPVVRWTASDWPAGADSARVRFWSSDTPVEPIGTIDVAKILGAAARSIAGLEGVEFEAYAVDEGTAFRVDVLERHGEGAPGVGTLGVEWVGPAPLDVVERFDAVHGVVLHTFRFDPASLRTPTGAIAVTPRAALEDGGLTLEPPAVIDIPDQADLLVPFRAPGSTEPASPPSQPPAVPAEPPAAAAPGATQAAASGNGAGQPMITVGQPSTITPP